MASFNIYTLGCKVNQYDSVSLKRRLLSSGLKFTEKNAQVAIINTCSVTKSAISKNKRMISRAKKENSRAKIILTGCWPKVYDVCAEDLGVDYVFRTGEDKLAEKISKLQFLISNKIPNSKFQIPKNCLNSECLHNKSRYFIKIQDGCEQYCTYCVIPYARGKLKSRSEKEIIDEINNAVKVGFREVVLSGIHIGLYGKDFKTQSAKLKVQNNNSKLKTNLFFLLKKLVKIKDLGRVRISSIEITEVSDELIKLIARTDKICNHLHIPLQSGCDKILKLMNRPYTIKYFESRIRKIRKTIPDIAITTDVIVGFPGETELDFKKTYEFCKEMKFSKIHVFSFSAHEKAPASKMKNKVSKAEITMRSKKLRALSLRQEKEYKNKFRGKELEVVIENKAGKILKGKSEYYFDIECGAIKEKTGSIIKVKSWK
jgi:threonylcarbamoyladenosine tRNA methylthiotransferase MtaB